MQSWLLGPDEMVGDVGSGGPLKELIESPFFGDRGGFHVELVVTSHELFPDKVAVWDDQ